MAFSTYNSSCGYRTRCDENVMVRQAGKTTRGSTASGLGRLRRYDENRAAYLRESIALPGELLFLGAEELRRLQLRRVGQPHPLKTLAPPLHQLGAPPLVVEAGVCQEGRPEKRVANERLLLAPKACEALLPALLLVGEPSEQRD